MCRMDLIAVAACWTPDSTLAVGLVPSLVDLTLVSTLPDSADQVKLGRLLCPPFSHSLNRAYLGQLYLSTT